MKLSSGFRKPRPSANNNLEKFDEKKNPDLSTKMSTGNYFNRIPKS